MFKILKYILKTSKTAVLRPFRLFKRKIKKALFLKSKVGKAIKSSVKETIGVIKRSPEKKDDYVLFGNHYFSKRIIIVGLVFAIFIIAISQVFIIPFLRGKLFTPTVALSDDLLIEYTGKINIINRDSIVIFKGKMENGKCTGNGIQYDDLGKLVYQGEFYDDFYNGSGVLYGSDEKVIYEGGFVNNLYSGNGKLYDLKHNIKYQGNFENGVYSGNGKLYEDERMIYSGNFLQGMANGYGVNYFEDGTIKYSGNFQNGLFNGIGTLYNNNMTKLYSGMFENGVFSGQGKTFLKNGDIAYEGNFKEGYYSGEGKLYGVNYLYEGNFEKGAYEGSGKFYVGDTKVYEGQWVNGSIDFLSLLNSESIEIANVFSEEGIITIFDDKYTLEFKEAKCVFVFSLPEEDKEPLIEKIIVKNFDLNLPFKEKMKIFDVENILKSSGINEELISKEFVTLNSEKLSKLYSEVTTKNKFFLIRIRYDQELLNLYFDFNSSELLFYEYSI